MKTRLKTAGFIITIGYVLLCLLSFLTFLYPFLIFFIPLLTFFVSFLMPQIMKVIFPVKPYNGPYRDQLLGMAKKSQVKLNDIYEMKSNMLNARACGMLNNKAIILNSATLERCSKQEIEGIMAHEIGHHKDFGIYIYTGVASLLLILGIKLVIMTAVVTGFSFLITSLLIMIIFTPLVFKVSRVMEHQADLYALNYLKTPQGFARFFVRLVDEYTKKGDNFPENPGILMRLLGTHDWVYDRIKLFKR